MEKLVFNLKLLEDLFPFYFILKEDLSISHKGKSLLKILPKAASFQEAFTFIRPRLGIEYKFDSIIKFKDQVFILRFNHLPSPINLKGQFIFDDLNNIILFCGSPWITNDDDFLKSNLLISDFALHDSLLDLLQVTNSLKMEYDDKILLGEEIEKQKLFYESLLNNIPLDIAIFDDNFRFKFLNKNAVKNDEIRKWLLNKTLKDYYQFRNLDLSLADERQAQFQQAINTKIPLRYQEVYNEFSKNEKVMLRELFPYEDRSGKTYLLAYGVDITELKKGRDNLLAKNKELEKLNEELDSFVYSITHDLRTPVLALLGLIDVLDEKVESGSGNQDYFVLMRKSVNRLDDTIREILNYYRNARTEIVNTEINLIENVKASFDAVKYFVKYKIRLETTIQADCPFYSDKKRILPILNNLISNAVKYSCENDGNAFVKFSAKIDHNSCLFTIEDNGEGISFEQQGLVFKIFHRASNSAPGSGLGLFICSELVKKLGGEISLVSNAHKGISVTVKLPNNINSELELSL